MATVTKMLFIDTETTGLDATARVIQVGAVPVVLTEAGRLEQEGPGMEWTLPSDGLVWSMGAAMVNGWPKAYVGKQVTYPDAFLSSFTELAHKRMICGHNVAFDKRMLEQSFPSRILSGASHRSVDSQSLAFYLVVRGKIPSTGLKVCHEYFAARGQPLFDNEDLQHTALADAMASFRLAKYLLEDMGAE